MKQLENKVAIITGASSGMGRQTALTFAERGAKVVVADINVAGGESVVEEIKRAGGIAAFQKTDVSSAESVESMVEKTLELYGRLDCAFNNAGIEGKSTKLVDCTEEIWDRTIAVDLKGVWLCMKYEIPKMLESGGGAIVNTASIAGLGGSPGLPAYGAAKFGVVGLTKTAAVEYAKRGIRVNAICPGVIRTPMVDRLFADNPKVEKAMQGAHPIGRIGEPLDIALGVAWLCSDESAFLTGQAIPFDGGMTATSIKT